MRACDRVNFTTFSPLFSLATKTSVYAREVSRIFASRRSGSHRSAHGMPNVMAEIYLSFSANRDGRRRPRSRECQLFFPLFRVFCGGCEAALCVKRRKREKVTKTRRRGGERNFSRFRVSRTTATEKSVKKGVKREREKCRKKGFFPKIHALDSIKIGFLFRVIHAFFTLFHAFRRKKPGFLAKRPVF